MALAAYVYVWWGAWHWQPICVVGCMALAVYVYEWGVHGTGSLCICVGGCMALAVYVYEWVGDGALVASDCGWEEGGLGADERLCDGGWIKYGLPRQNPHIPKAQTLNPFTANPKPLHCLP